MLVGCLRPPEVGGGQKAKRRGGNEWVVFARCARHPQPDVNIDIGEEVSFTASLRSDRDGMNMASLEEASGVALLLLSRRPGLMI